MSEAVFEVREAILSPCDHLSCERWATVELALEGAAAWAFSRVCGYHQRWAKQRLVEPAPEEAP